MRLDDDAIYARTRRGQSELVNPTTPLTLWQRKFLGMVTGHTPLRTMMDLIGDTSGAAGAIAGLVEAGFVECVVEPVTRTRY